METSFITVGAPLADTPWPMFGHDPQHTGRSPYNGPESPTEKWSFTTGDSVSSSPAIAIDGTIYVGSDDNKLYAINPEGTEKWNFTTVGGIRASPAIAADGTIYVGSWDHKLYAINPDGSQKWTFTTGSQVKSSPAIAADGTIYISSGYPDNKLYAINPDGSQKWTFTTGYSVDDALSIATDGTIYVGSYRYLYAINPDGSEKWISDLEYSVWFPHAIASDGTIYVVDQNKKLHAINPDGSEKWSIQKSNDSSPTIDSDGTIYMGTGCILLAINPDGSEKWSFYTGQAINYSPAIASDGTLYVGSDDHKVYAIGSKHPPTQPTNTSPSDGAASISLTPTLFSSAFSDPDAGDTHASSEWQATITPGDYSSPIFARITGGENLTHTTISAGTLEYNTTYYWHVRHQDNNGYWSQWSGETSFITVGAPLADTPWPMFGHDPQHTGRSPYTGPDVPAEKWSFTNEGLGPSSPAIAVDGTIYLGSGDNKLYAINPDGTQKWSFTTEDYVSSSPAIAADGTIYVGSYDNKLYAINPDGTQKWSFATGDSVHSSPAVASDGTIYVGSDDNNLYAINPDGTQKWSFTTGNLILSPPAIAADGTIYVGSYDNKLYAINPDGTQKWSFATGNLILSSPAIAADGTIYVGSRDHNLYAINPDGTQKWSFATAYFVKVPPAIDTEGTIYAVSIDYKLYAINPDGIQKWSFATEGPIFSSSPTIAADGTIYVVSDNTKLHAIGELPIETILNQIRLNVSQLRELSPTEEVEYYIITSDELSQQPTEDVTEEYIEAINITQEILVLLDLMEEGQDLYEILLNLYSESVAGFYDSETDELYVISDSEQLSLAEEKTYAHEYTHALQDMHFDLSSLGLDGEDNSDFSIAVLSLVEGDAELMEEIYYWTVFDDAEREAYDQQTTGSDGEALDDIPQVIIQDLIFPYTAGKNFVYTLWEEGGWDAVNQAYSDLPQSTEQIIHPEKYLDGDEPQPVTLPDLEGALGGTWLQMCTDVLGELYMILYLEAFIDIDQAKEAAEGWDGDRFVYLKDSEDRKLLVLRSVWDSVAEAEEFFDTYTDFVGEKNDDSWDLKLDDSDKKWWVSEGLSLYLGQEGSDVLIIIAPDEAIAEAVLGEFSEFHVGLTIETIFPDIECTVEAVEGMVTIQFPVDAVSSETVIIVREHVSSDAPSAPSGFKLGDTSFSIEGISSLSEEITITIKYSTADLETAGGDPQQLALSRWDEEAGEWVMLPTTVNESAQTLTVTTSHLSLWAVVAGVGLTIETIFPDTECTVEAVEGMVTIQFPVGAVNSETVIIVREHISSDAPSAPSGFKLGDTFFSIEGISSLSEEITITIKYSTADLETAGGDPQQLALSRWDEEAGEWVMLPTTVNESAQTLTVTTSHLSLWAVMAGEIDGVLVPDDDSTPIGEGIDDWVRDNLWTLVGGGTAFLLLLMVTISITIRLRIRKEVKRWKEEGYRW